MKTLNIEIIFAAKAMAKVHDHVFLGGNIDGEPSEIYCTDERTDNTSGCRIIGMEIRLRGKAVYKISISYDVDDQDNYIGRWAGCTKVDDDAKTEAIHPITLGSFFEENIFENKYQDLISAWVEKYLGNAVDVSWDERVIDVVKSVNVNGGVMFIIPNPIGTADRFLIRKEEHAAEAAEIARLNGCKYDRETTRLVEVWMSSPRASWYYDNLEDHGPYVKDKDGNHYFIDFPRFLPETVMEEFKEGRLTSIQFPSRVRKATQGDDYDDTYNAAKLSTIIDFTFVPAQTITRYRSFGTIEETLKKLQ